MSEKNSSVPDEAARRHALDPAQSFIVQAPAGAGKTELLTQRFLVLLASVERPEEILAITFTRKAAAEMRARVLDALTRAGNETPPESPHQRRTWDLARRARERDAERGWRVQENPGRLGIQTIDSFCLGLTRQMPLLARFGAPPAIVEDSAELYREAARATLALLDDESPHARAVEQLLRHLDNDFRRAAGMLADMLARRDQWLRRVGDRDRLQRETLEAALANVLSDALSGLQRALPQPLAGEIAFNVRVAAENLHAADAASPIRACLDLRGMPGRAPDQLPQWLGIATLLLKADGEWRAQLTKAHGFPAKTDGKTAAAKQSNDEAKKRALALIEKLAAYPDFGRRLHDLRVLPPPRYDDEQWDVLQALVKVLPVAAAQLKLVFAERGGVDFTEVSQGALEALGDPEAPTDLLLALDYRLRHVLVDEFQDTSFSQSGLLMRLTAGWTPGDGRTLFLVGDPMQSIYRFREAEVGLYLSATHEGIGSVPLTKLTLSANFRSQAGVVDWINHTFEKVFPVEEDIAAGAVSYAPCQAVHAVLRGAAVTVHPMLGNDPVVEADKVVALVTAAQAENASGSTAILVRTRTHLAAIVPQLKRAGFRYRAIEIERLAERQIVQDLLGLTRALLHPADRTAWLALLRAPWCGLMLSDLHQLAADDHKAAIWDLMLDETRVQRLSPDGQRRLIAARVVLAEAIASRGRSGLRRQVEGVWIALGGPACVRDETDLADAEVYFQLLDELDDGAVDLGHVAEQAEKLFAASDVEADDRLQIMTIHKAKGLEFDTVIVPGLGRKQRSETARLLAWTERARGQGKPDLLLAPIHATGSDGDAIAEYLRSLDHARARHEDMRLLYVAATRAKNRLHLLGHTTVGGLPQQPELKQPASGSLLGALWPAVESIYAAALQATPVPAQSGAPAVLDWSTVQDLTRLASGWKLPPPPAAVQVDVQPPIVSVDDEIEFKWVGETARHVGTVVHRWLMRIGADGLAGWNDARVHQQETAIQLSLAQLGVAAEEIQTSVKKVIAALTTALGDPRARWLLDAHTEARSEYALTGVLDGRVANVVLDRTFVDNEGVRWIVDYKTSEHEGADSDAFLDSEQTRYTAQLERYARLLGKTETRPIKLGLYFPMLRGWREWEVKK